MQSTGSSKTTVFIPGEPLKACVQDRVKGALGTHSYIYKITLKHGNFKWCINRTHTQLRKFSSKLPSQPDGKQQHWASPRRVNLLKREDHLTPRCPTTPEMMIQTESAVKKRMNEIERFLNWVLNTEWCLNDSKTLKFLEVSQVSFTEELGGKYKEGIVKKKSGDRKTANNEIGRVVEVLHTTFHSVRSKTWLALKDTFLVIIRPSDDIIRDVIFFDRKFHVVKNPPDEPSNSLKILNLNRDLSVVCKNEEELEDWFQHINSVASKAEDFVQLNRFDSFVPERKNIFAKWFVDGCDYFEAVADGLEAAKEQIFIADWMLSPQLYLKRPVAENTYWRLDHILKRKADEGVKIYILVFNEVELVMGLNSTYVKQYLQTRHPENIKVLRRRGFVNAMIWSPHDKLVVIDQKYAFLGGIDLCFGRWDDHKHRLIDNGINHGKNFITEGSELTSVIGNLAVQMGETLKSTVRTSAPLLPIVGPVLSNVLDTVKDSSRVTFYVDEVDHSERVSLEVNSIPEGVKWPGKDYMNFIYKDFQHVESPFTDLINRSEIPRMPWHDIGAYVQGEPARDLVRHFIQRWNLAKSDGHKSDDFYPILLPKCYKGLDSIEPLFARTSCVNCQVLRSAPTWSVGLREPECSIHAAYKHIIENARHFIYIENQFFVSLTGSGKSDVTNQIADYIYERIHKAHKNKEQFRVYVVMPLLPGIEGDISSESGGRAIRAVTHWNYASICRGSHSLYGRLSEKVGNPTKYISFCGLRTYDATEECEGHFEPKTELVYVHSKIIIVDDRVAIIGSANINDRSMKGTRDDEIAIRVEDLQYGRNREGMFVGSLRRRLFREHLGLMDGNPKTILNIDNPASDAFYKDVWLNVATKNTDIFEKVFSCIPSDDVKTFAQLEERLNKVDRFGPSYPDAVQQLEEIRGHLVLLPLYFLSEEDLYPHMLSSVEGTLPNYLWT